MSVISDLIKGSWIVFLAGLYIFFVILLGVGFFFVLLLTGNQDQVSMGKVREHNQ